MVLPLLLTVLLDRRQSEILYVEICDLSMEIWVKNGLFASIACGYCTINYCWKLSYGHVHILTNLYAYISIKSPTDE